MQSNTTDHSLCIWQARIQDTHKPQAILTRIRSESTLIVGMTRGLLRSRLVLWVNSGKLKVPTPADVRVVVTLYPVCIVYAYGAFDFWYWNTTAFAPMPSVVRHDLLYSLDLFLGVRSTVVLTASFGHGQTAPRVRQTQSSTLTILKGKSGGH